MVVTANCQRELQLDQERALVLWLEDVAMSNMVLVGGKNASLGEIIQQFTPS